MIENSPLRAGSRNHLAKTITLRYRAALIGNDHAIEPDGHRYNRASYYIQNEIERRDPLISIPMTGASTNEHRSPDQYRI